MFSDNDWLAGFTDGEGCFALQRGKDGWVQPTFRIGLRADDIGVLRELQAEFGGSLHVRDHGSGAAVADWVVGSKRDLLKICMYFEAHELRAKKQGDYAIWREAVRAYFKGGRRAPELHVFHKALRDARAFDADHNAPLPAVEFEQPELRLVG